MGGRTSITLIANGAKWPPGSHLHYAPNYEKDTFLVIIRFFPLHNLLRTYSVVYSPVAASGGDRASVIASPFYTPSVCPTLYLSPE